MGTGRRGSEIVMSMILISNNDYIELLSDNPTSLPPDEAAMREFIVGMGCRRMCLSTYMNGDGEEVNCEMLAGEICDICLSSGSLYGNELVKRRREMDETEVREIKKRRGLAERERLLRKSVMERGEQLEAVIDMHEWLQHKCAVCWLLHGEAMEEHRTNDCPELIRELGMPYKLGFRREYLVYKASSCCYRCGLPGDLCYAYANRLKCEADDVILPSVLMSYLKKELGLLDVIKEFAHRGFEDVFEFSKWMMERRRWLGVNGTNAFGVFSIIMRQSNR
jgi:hypothetical protein